MGTQKKIIITQVQSSKIHKLLEADKGDTPLQKFIDDIKTAGEVEEWVAEKFASSWRFHHRNNDQTETQDQQLKNEIFYVQNELPSPSKKSTDPANGTGKVAQIIQLAEKGFSTQQIIAQGFNKSTVYRQVSEWRQRKKLTKAS
jgi:hypothetical protein